MLQNPTNRELFKRTLSMLGVNTDFDMLNITYHMSILYDFYIPLNEYMICLYYNKNTYNYNSEIKRDIKKVFDNDFLEYFEIQINPSETRPNAAKTLYAKMSSFL